MPTIRINHLSSVSKVYCVCPIIQATHLKQAKDSNRYFRKEAMQMAIKGT
jgi:hypothetical protein